MTPIIRLPISLPLEEDKDSSQMHEPEIGSQGQKTTQILQLMWQQNGNVALEASCAQKGFFLRLFAYLRVSMTLRYSDYEMPTKTP